MKNLKFRTLGALILAGSPVAMAKPKTTFPVKVDPVLVSEAPFRFNGVVLTDEARGSGFCAWNQQAYFSAAHVVYSESGWGAPPLWVPTVNEKEVNPDTAIQTRGYYRFNRYAEIVDEQGASAAFGKDVILGFAFKNLIPGSPAKLNLNGANDLRTDISKFITGYPAVEAYTDEETDGYFMHQTGPFNIPFSNSSNGSVATTLVTTGPGNSGGPVWTRNKKGTGWSAAGVLVGGLPSESEVYAMSKDITALTRSVQPVIKRNPELPFPVRGVSASSLFFPYTQSQQIPDAAEKWSSYIVGVRGFGEGTVVKKVKLDLTIRTAHRGDLQIYVIAPGGFTALIQNEDGAGKDDFIVEDLDLSGNFVGIDPIGKWAVRVRDRLKGDIATLDSYRLEIEAVEDSETEPEP